MSDEARLAAPEAQQLAIEDLRDAWRLLDSSERVEGFRLLGLVDGEEFFIALPTTDQRELLNQFTPIERRHWVRMLAPDDAADLLQEVGEERRNEWMALFDEPVRREVAALLAYSEDAAGGLMSPRFARVRPEQTVDEAILYLRRQAFDRLELIYYGYVLDREQRLLGVVSFRDLFRARGSAYVRDVMKTDVASVPEEMDQESVGRLFAEQDLVALPVVDSSGRMKGIVTVDDIVDVVQEEATEDIQKIGGSVALDAPYLEVGLLGMLKKRLGWLTILFFAQMLTVVAMSYFQAKIETVSLLALFVPLIISSGGNSGSQASTLVIRAMSLGEVRLSDWKRVFVNELLAGLSLGAVLGVIGFARIMTIWPGTADEFAMFSWGLAATILCSVVGVVLWGTLIGSMLPLVLRRLGLDPASASAPLVATLCDVTGILVYFMTASFWLSHVFVPAATP
ncbi:MAG: magnesium transporter [Planctomycetes bacterium]|nr:magnesium transporter [Planctomycetota bacterium]